MLFMVERISHLLRAYPLAVVPTRLRDQASRRDLLRAYPLAVVPTLSVSTETGTRNI